jgi:hypothetical protein
MILESLVNTKILKMRNKKNSPTLIVYFLTWSEFVQDFVCRLFISVLPMEIQLSREGVLWSN